MEYRALSNFRNNKNKYTKGKLYSFSDKDKGKELEAAGLIEPYKGESLVTDESLSQERDTFKKENIKLKSEVADLKRQIKKAETKEKLGEELLAFLTSKEALVKMENSLLIGIGNILEVELEGKTKEELSDELVEIIEGSEDES